MNERNKVIDECIKKIEELIQLNCEDHTPYRGACGNCGSYHNFKTLPIPKVVIDELKSMKT
jgi:hypothetical protein